MMRMLVTMATVFSLLMGTGAFNVACLCKPCPPLGSGDAAWRGCHEEPSAADDANCAGCCCEKPADSPETPRPGERTPDRCPCLYWTDTPLTQGDAPTGVSLVKRTLCFAPILLLEAVPRPLVALGTAATFRTGPPGWCDGVRLQAWTCVWTT